jgi:hypothetical protein
VNRTWKLLFGAGLAASLLLDVIRPTEELAYPWDYMFFYAAMGFVGTFVLTALAKYVLSWTADRAEDYYEPYAITEREATAQGLEGEDDDVW